MPHTFYQPLMIVTIQALEDRQIFVDVITNETRHSMWLANNLQMCYS